MRGRIQTWPVILLLSSVALAQQNMVYNGDLENDSKQSPPPGWAMWGFQQYKVPENFTRDTTVSHSGKASLRIHHPANTRGYLVTDPQHAIRPKEGMTYSVSFWAKANKPVQTSFAFTAYESIKPFREAPSPGSWPISVGAEWKQYSFQFNEGIDFFAPRSQYLLLTFYATHNPAEEATLWVDDVQVTEKLNPDPVRLVDETTLKAAPIDHRLKQGDRLEITVDAAKVLRPTPREVAGISFHRLSGWTGVPYDRQGNYVLAPELEQAIRDLHLPMTRFYGVGHERFTVEEAIDKAADLCRRINVPMDRVSLELEEQSANRQLPPVDWAKAVKRSVEKGYGFRYWEVGNEIYSQTFNNPTPMGQAFKTPDDYVAHVQTVGAAVKAVQPTAQIGLSINSASLPWGNYVLRKAAGSYDFVCPHYYAVWQTQGRKFEAVELTENFRVLERAARLKALVAAYNPGRDVYIYDTEWGMHSSGSAGQRADAVTRNGNTWGALHRAIRMIYYAREGQLKGASSWEMLTRLADPGFAILTKDAPAKRSLIYWLYYHFNRHLGESVLDIQGAAPYYSPAAGEDNLSLPGELPGPLTPAVATLSSDGKTMYVILANASWDKPIPCRLTLRSFPARQATALVLSQRDPEGSPWVDKQEDVVTSLPVTQNQDQWQMTLPAHSVMFLKLSQ